jgi:hypothetical protein
LSQSQLARRMKTSQSYIAHRGWQGTPVNLCSGALRSGDRYAPSDHLRT